MNAPLPFARAYWVRPGRLLAGAYPGAPHPEQAAQQLESLLRCGVTHLVSLMEEHEHSRYGRLCPDYRPLVEKLAARQPRPLACLRQPMPDMTAPPVETLRGTLDTIDRILREGGVAYVHCLAGRGRTGTVIGCHLVRHGLPGPVALDRLKELTRERADLFWPTPQTPEQRQCVLDWPLGQ